MKKVGKDSQQKPWQCCDRWQETYEKRSDEFDRDAVLSNRKLIGRITCCSYCGRTIVLTLRHKAILRQRVARY